MSSGSSGSSARGRTFRQGDVVCARYRVDRFLSGYGLEENYVVRSLLDQRELLLKVIAWPAGSLESVQAEVPAWENTARIVASLRAATLSQTLEIVPLTEQGVTLLVREPVELVGKTLLEFLQTLKRPLRENEVLDLASQLAEALDALHRAQVFHFALSMRRVVVLQQGDGLRIKLSDAGLYPAKIAARFAEPGYLAPEVLGQAACEARADQFSLAVLLYELLSGQPAFIGGEDEPREVVAQRVLYEDPLPLVLSKKIDSALQRALSRSPIVRFGSVRDFVEALGCSVQRIAKPTGARVRAVSRKPRVAWTRLWLPLAQGALWAVCGLGVVLGVRKLLTSQKGVVISTTKYDLATADLFTSDLVGSDQGSLGDLSRAEETPDMKKGKSLGSLSGHSEMGTNGTNGARTDRLDSVPARNTNGMGLVRKTDAKVEVVAHDGKLTEQQEDKLRGCLRLVLRPAVPYRIVLQNINGKLLVETNHTSAEFQMSRDFRDCLKLQISGIVSPKVVTISGKPKEKTTP